MINFGFCRPQEPVSAIDFMPNYRKPELTAPEKTEAQLQSESDYNVRIAELAAQMKAGKGDLYEEICLGRKPHSRKPAAGRKRTKRAQP